MILAMQAGHSLTYVLLRLCNRPDIRATKRATKMMESND